MNQSPNNEHRPDSQPIIINIDQHSIASAIKGFFLGYFGVIIFVLIIIIFCWFTLIIAGLFIR